MSDTVADGFTELLNASEPDSTAILGVVYGQLRRIAQQRMSTERADHTLQATALVNEAYMRLVDQNDPQSLLAYNGFLTAAMASGNAPQIIMEMAQDLNAASRMMALSPVQQVAEYTRRVMAAQSGGPVGTGAENTGGAAGANGVLQLRICLWLTGLRGQRDV